MSKFMASQIGQQIIPVHILLIISRTKSNQTAEFGQLYAKYGSEASLRPFCKKSKLSIFLD